MRILLINVDSRWNMAIRRMMTYYTAQGHDVEMRDLKLSGYPHNRKVRVDASGYDQVYVSNIFERNAYRVTVEGCDAVEFGGIGSRNPERQLPPEVEAAKPFYFKGEKVSYGFITRGCIRSCWFCKVPKHEGKLKVYNAVEDIVRGVPHERVSFLDNNILAYPDHCEIFRWLIERKVKCEFNQGLDFRLVNDENLSLLAQLNYIGPYIFAFDDVRYEKLLEKKVALIKKYIPAPWRLKFYIYVHPDMGLGEIFRRVEWCRAHECLPYIMRDQACWESPLRGFYVDYAAYCNQAAFFKSMTFKQFLEKRATAGSINSKRAMAHSLLFKVWEEHQRETEA